MGLDGERGFLGEGGNVLEFGDGVAREDDLI